MFVYLRYGLTLAPRLFTKVLKLLFAALNKESMIYHRFQKYDSKSYKPKL